MMNIALQIAGKIQKLVEIKIIELHSCKLQYNQINQTCDYNQDNIEICSAQQAEADEELLYTETDFSKHICWQMLTDFCFYVNSHVDNITL